MFSRSRCDLQFYMFSEITAGRSPGAGCHFLDWRRGNTTPAAGGCRPGRPKVRKVRNLGKFSRFGEIPHILRNFAQKQKNQELFCYAYTLARATATFQALGAKSKKNRILQNCVKFCKICEKVRIGHLRRPKPPA